MSPLKYWNFQKVDNGGEIMCADLYRVMESLNLLRYLVIRDKVTENQVSAGRKSLRFE